MSFRASLLSAALPGFAFTASSSFARSSARALRPTRLEAALSKPILAAAFSVLSLLAQPAVAKNPAQDPLKLFQNYFITGDYVVGGVGLRGLGVNGMATGTIRIPDANSVPSTGVPGGADIVAAYLYWQTVESSQAPHSGQKGFFNGYAISGQPLGNPLNPVSWSSGGCSGSSNGAKTMTTYRADVHPFLKLDSSGNAVGNASYQVSLPDSGTGGASPLTFGASLVLIYRVLSPSMPLNGIAVFDGSYAPSNGAQSLSQQIYGFYQAANSTTPVAKLTQIVGNGQSNKNETVDFNTSSLPSLYPGQASFPGYYNGSWDNPTWVPNTYGNLVAANDSSEMISITPSATNSGCVSWGAMIFSTTVQDTDGDGLLDIWESEHGYTDAASGQSVALPGADPNVKDIFVELDYLSNLDGSAGPYKHSHLPKQAALDIVGNTFAAQGIKVHFDVGNVYQGDPYIISNPAGTGGNAISEGALLCTDNGTSLCAFPGQPAVGWKGGLLYVRDNASVPNSNPAQPLGNFQPGRQQSYHYVLFGHSLAAPRSIWSTEGAALSNPAIPALVSVVNSGTTATITIQSPQGVIKPGDCPNSAVPGCSDSNSTRITVSGALTQPDLNGTYEFSSPASSAGNNNVTRTTFTITTTKVANGTYDFSNEPQLNVSYLGPSSTSGHSDFGGGGDSIVTLGLWGADDPMGCQPDPSKPPTGQPPTYCIDQTGTIAVQAGTLLHEIGHTLTLTHGGAYYRDQQNPSVATYELNCKPNFLSVMNYLFQVRGFADGAFDYSAQTLPPLSETGLSESAGIGPAAHPTSWYAPPNNQLDMLLQNNGASRYATRHCDGTPLGLNEAHAVRVDASVAAGGNNSASLDWNNDLIVPDVVNPPGIDVNYNGVVGDSAFSGLNEWQILLPANGPALRQIAARGSAFGFSGGGQVGTGGGQVGTGGGQVGTGGGQVGTGGGQVGTGGGEEQDVETATSTVDPPNGLNAQASPQSTHNVLLSWTAPAFGQIRTYSIWRATGSFPTLKDIRANVSQFTMIKTLTGSPPLTTFTDTDKKLQNKTTYTYFVTDTNKQGVQSGASAPVVFQVVF
jgi:hypothetical protein